jgi:hypothetical protein
MSPSLDALTREDPVALVESCHRALLWILRTHQSKPIPRFWIDHPYGEEEITLLEEELLPVMARLLQRIEEIDAELEAGFQAESAQLQAAGECEHEALMPLHR